jgi:hypothetical protein
MTIATACVHLRRGNRGICPGFREVGLPLLSNMGHMTEEGGDEMHSAEI